MFDDMTVMLKDIGKIIYRLLTYSSTEYGRIDEFVEYSSVALTIISIIAVLIFIFRIPNLKKHERTEDKYIFWDCIIVLMLLTGNLLLEAVYYSDREWVQIVGFIITSVTEFLYMLAILQWLVFVDYSLYRSRDHIKRRYRHAVIPVIVVVAADIILTVILYLYGMDTLMMEIITDIPYLVKLAIELGYIITAFKLVKDYDRESREPKFLSLSAFVVPFIVGCFFRFYDESLMALGIMLTYRAVIKRDSYLEHDTGFYNRDFLIFLGEYRDKMEYTGGNGILIRAKGHGRDMEDLLKEIKPADSNIFVLGDECFLMLSESLRGSAVQMAVTTITEAAEGQEDPYTPEITTMIRESDETAEAFTERLLKSA